jgi:hypothetical protein
LFSKSLRISCGRHPREDVTHEQWRWILPVRACSRTKASRPRCAALPVDPEAITLASVQPSWRALFERLNMIYSGTLARL